MRIRPGHFAGCWTLALLLALAAGCRSIGWNGPSGRAPLRIGTVVDSPPLAFRDGRRWLGVEADLGRAFADRLGMRPVVVPLPAEQLVPALLDGQVDVLMAGLTVTEARRVRIDFASPYLVVGQAALIRRSDLLRFNTDIKIRSAPVRVAVVEDGAGDRLVARYFPNARRLPFPDGREAIDALRRNEADLLIHDAPELWWLALGHVEDLMLAPALFAREEIAWGFRRGSVSLRESANRAIAEWRHDGTLEAVLRRWIPVSR
jgi:ABC-type amino acid transport substrate-binding protein